MIFENINTTIFQNIVMAINATKGTGKEMRAVAIDRFGGPEVLSVRNVPMPEVGPEQVLNQSRFCWSWRVGCR